MSLAVVLGGGGVAGIAWELGVLLGLADGGLDVTGAARVVGTSAGSAVAAQITTDVPLADLYARQLADSTTERMVDFDADKLWTTLREAVESAHDENDAYRRIGASAMAADTVPEAERREIIAARLPSTAWPDRDMVITAVDCESGQVRGWTRDCGVSLVDAVASSCAVPGVWPPVTIDGRRYMDGGVASPTHVAMAAGFSEVLVVAPMPGRTFASGLEDELAALPDRTRTHAIVPDEPSLVAFGLNPLDPSRRRPSAEAGRAVGRVEAARVRAALQV